MNLFNPAPRSLWILPVLAIGLFTSSVMANEGVTSGEVESSAQAQAQAQPQTTSQIPALDTLSPNYDAKARAEFSHNDVAAFVYQWFAGFDHQREARFFLERIAEPVALHYPDAPLRSVDDFLGWYQGVIDNIAWNAHELSELSIQGNQQQGWQVSYLVRWQARDYSGQNLEMDVAQQLVIVREGEALKIAQLRAKLHG
ncbi:hypothetical protein [Ferrimonas marina]|uniref:SnoaL-like domain-containing protein n=1 Tax=Ferrimonas marina TaxID=299255 RepID=A0A1M5R516_9GAMM|nr:hypothetical protein [Ferrimonas marina]SHH21079.1 hypothetical protein SAMN02745129_1476 [Ferrimonas marina]